MQRVHHGRELRFDLDHRTRLVGGAPLSFGASFRHEADHVPGRTALVGRMQVGAAEGLSLGLTGTVHADETHREVDGSVEGRVEVRLAF